LLEEHHHIVMKQQNSQLYHVYPNDKDLLISLQQDIDRFEELLLKLSTAVNNNNLSEQEIRSIIGVIYIIYKHFIDMYVIRALAIWPKLLKTSDQELLGMLYTILFSRLKNINANINATIGSVAGGFEVAWLQTLTFNSFLLTPPQIEHMLEVAKKSHTTEEICNILDHVWKIFSEFLPWAKPHFDKEHHSEGHKLEIKWNPTDWREALKYWRDQ
jgi:hypothetical protein